MDRYCPAASSKTTIQLIKPRPTIQAPNVQAQSSEYLLSHTRPRSGDPWAGTAWRIGCDASNISPKLTAQKFQGMRPNMTPKAYQEGKCLGPMQPSSTVRQEQLQSVVDHMNKDNKEQAFRVKEPLNTFTATHQWNKFVSEENAVQNDRGYPIKRSTGGEPLQYDLRSNQTWSNMKPLFQSNINNGENLRGRTSGPNQSSQGEAYIPSDRGTSAQEFPPYKSNLNPYMQFTRVSQVNDGTTRCGGNLTDQVRRESYPGLIQSAALNNTGDNLPIDHYRQQFGSPGNCYLNTKDVQSALIERPYITANKQSITFGTTGQILDGFGMFRQQQQRQFGINQLESCKQDHFDIEIQALETSHPQPKSFEVDRFVEQLQSKSSQGSYSDRYRSFGDQVLYQQDYKVPVNLTLNYGKDKRKDAIQVPVSVSEYQISSNQIPNSNNRPDENCTTSKIQDSCNMEVAKRTAPYIAGQTPKIFTMDENSSKQNQNNSNANAENSFRLDKVSSLQASAQMPRRVEVSCKQRLLTKYESVPVSLLKWSKQRRVQREALAKRTPRKNEFVDSKPNQQHDQKHSTPNALLVNDQTICAQKIKVKTNATQQFQENSKIQSCKQSQQTETNRVSALNSKNEFSSSAANINLKDDSSLQRKYLDVTAMKRPLNAKTNGGKYDVKSAPIVGSLTPEGRQNEKGINTIHDLSSQKATDEIKEGKKPNINSTRINNSLNLTRAHVFKKNLSSISKGLGISDMNNLQTIDCHDNDGSSEKLQCDFKRMVLLNELGSREDSSEEPISQVTCNRSVGGKGSDDVNSTSNLSSLEFYDSLDILLIKQAEQNKQASFQNRTDTDVKVLPNQGYIDNQSALKKKQVGFWFKRKAQRKK